MHCPFSSIFRSTVNPKVVRISNNEHLFEVGLFRLSVPVFRSDISFAYRTPLPLAFNPVVEFVKNDVCKEWRNDSTLWCSLIRRNKCSVLKFYLCCQYSPKHKYKRLIVNPHCPNLPNQLCMVHIVKKSFNIEFNDIVQVCLL